MFGCLLYLYNIQFASMNKFKLLLLIFIQGIHLNAQTPGALDTSFSAVTGNFAPYALSCEVQPDGKILVGGQFDYVNGILTHNLVRLHANGEVDTLFNNNLHSSTFYSFPGLRGKVFSINLLPDGKILVGSTGGVLLGAGYHQHGVTRLHANGVVDTTFIVGDGANTPSTNIEVFTTHFLQDGKIFLAGNFQKFDTTVKNNLARINYNGSIDTTFNTGIGTNNDIFTSAVQSDGKIIIGGIFTYFNGEPVNYLVRLNVDGSRDSSFQIGTGPNNWIRSCIVQPDGKIILAGDFTEFNGVSKNKIVRINPNGTIDNSFNIGTGANDKIFDVELQSNGKVLVGAGYYTNVFNGMPVPKLFRLNDNGSYDITFNPGTAANTWLEDMVVQPDGKIIVVGNFDTYNGVYTSRIIRVHGDTAMDNCFNFKLFFNSISNFTCTDSIGSATATPFYGHPPFQYIWNTSPTTTTATLNVTTPGIYTATITDTLGCNKTASLFIQTPPVSGFDLGVYVVAGSFRPASFTNVNLEYKNRGCDSIDADLKFVIDSSLNLIMVTPPADTIIGDTIIWNNVVVTSESSFNPVITFYSPINSIVGTTLNFKSIAEPLLGDVNITDNIKNYIFSIVNSFDPNDKSVYPQGDCDFGYVEPNQQLNYTIRFENTGTANALNIEIIDSLDLDLDLTTLKILASSHDMFTVIDSGNVVRFIFNNINLPFVNSPVTANRGYLVFGINPVAGLADGTTIDNKSYIIFDTNSPIVTNIVTNTVSSVSQIPDTSVVQYGDTLFSNAIGASYQWVNCMTGNTPIPGAINPVFIAPAPGSYAVQVSANGCTATSGCYQLLNTGIGNFSYDMSNFIIETNDLESLVIKLSRNSLKDKCYFLLADGMGKTIALKEIDTERISISKKDLPQGIYFVKLFGDEKMIGFIKMPVVR